MRRQFALCFLLSLIVGVPASVRAQPLVDPNFLDFTVSLDHDTIDNTGQPLVQRYDLLLYAAGSSSPARVVSLGKPAPDTSGNVRLALSTILSPLPTGGTSYEVRIAAVGPRGSATSGPSNPFTFQVPCTYSVSPTSRSLGAVASTSTFAVTAPAGCTWSAVSSVSWITITGGSNGSGNGTVTFSAAANPTATTRSGSLRIAGLTRGVSQAGQPCTFAVSPTSQSVVRAGGPVSFAVTSPAGCAWTASEQSSWFSISTGGSGTGNGTVTFSVGANTGTQSRTASATIAGRTVSLFQSSGAAPGAPTGMRVIKKSVN
jgi:hypothetical protein